MKKIFKNTFPSITADAVTHGTVSKRHRLWQQIRRDKFIYLMLLPVIAYLAIFKYWPMAWLSISLYDYKLLLGIEGSKFVGLKHYIDFFTGLDFFRVLGNTLILNILQLVFIFPVPIIFALLLNELRRLRFKKLIQTVSYLPHFISTMVLVSMITTFLSPSVGLLGAITKTFGGEPVYYLGNPGYFRPIYILSGIWQTTGWSAIIYLSAITGIDPVLYEAAIVDGAGRFKQVIHVTLPGILNAIVIQLIMQIGNMLNVGFEKVFLLQNSFNNSVAEVLSTYVYKQGIVGTKFSYATAIGVFNSVVAFILVVSANAFTKKFSKTGLW